MKRIGVNVRLEVILKTALLGTAKILRKVLSPHLTNDVGHVYPEVLPSMNFV